MSRHSGRSAPARFLFTYLHFLFTYSTYPLLSLYTFAHLSAYYLLIRLCITLRLLSDVTISTAQYTYPSICMHVVVLIPMFLCALSARMSMRAPTLCSIATPYYYLLYCYATPPHTLTYATCGLVLLYS